MPDEEHYVGTLLEPEEAVKRLSALEAHITEVAYRHWLHTVRVEEERLREAEAERHPHSRSSSSSSRVGGRVGA
jgi:hypothetical protein